LHPAQDLGIENEAAAFLAGAMDRAFQRASVGLVRVEARQLEGAAARCQGQRRKQGSDQHAAS